VFEHGKRHVYVGLALGCVVTLVVHGIASVRAETALFDMLHWVHETQKDMKDYFWSTYEVEAPKDEKKEAPPPEPPPEVKEVAPVAQQLPVKIDDPYKNAPPPTKIAEAAPLLTAPGEDPYDGVATGNNANAMGLQSGAGTEKHGDTVRPGPSPDIGAPAGTVLGADALGLLVATGGGTLRIRRLQRPGGRMLEAPEFLRGFPVAHGTMLESRVMPKLVGTTPFPYRPHRGAA